MPMFALVDCNNFYVSCERMFQPKLKHRPVVILSNNDGCIISRSYEAKEIGIPMGAPMFKVRKDLQKHNVAVRSSNYALYGDMSARVMNVLSAAAPDCEIYSIDECFLDLTGISILDIETWCRDLRQHVYQWTGIPVSIGVGETKTLSKIANKQAKACPDDSGVFIISPENTTAHLHDIPIGDVWGIGRRWAKMLIGKGIHSARDLRDADDRWVRQRMGVIGLRTVQELRGISCSTLESIAPDKQVTCCTRTFARASSDKTNVKNAILSYAERAVEKMRHGGQVCRVVQVFVRTDRHDDDAQPYAASALETLMTPTSDSRTLVAAALRVFERIWRDGIKYRKAGVLLMDLSSAQDVIPSLIDDRKPGGDDLMKAIDQMNGRFGRGAVHLGLSGHDASWRMRQDHLSPRYTTRWEDIPRARI